MIPISDAASVMFYNRLVEIDPSTKILFIGDMTDQGRKLMQMITVAVNGLHDLDSLIPVVQDLGGSHYRYGVTDSHYGSVASALLWTLENGLGDAFTPEVKSAWTEAYMLLTSVMKDAAGKQAEATKAA